MILTPRFANLLAPVARPSRLYLSVMPLRAKIDSRQMSDTAPIARPHPDDEPHDVLFNSLYGLRTIELNRPKKLNSLNGSMIRKIIPRLKEWEKSDMINAVIMKGAGDKALCAGGDVAVLAQWNQEGPEGQARSNDYFASEYQLDHLIATYSKPYIAFMDGFTMGGGVGLSVHAPFRIATERTAFAMPETTIGFFPEVGGSFFLPRLDGYLGRYLALTSERLQGVQCLYHGVATHYIDSSSLADVEARIAELTIPDYATLQERYKIIDATLSEFVTGLPHDQPIKLSGSLRMAIDRCFEFERVEEIYAALENEETHKDWAKKTLDTMHERSPTSLKVTLEQMRLGKNWSISESFDREYHIAAKFMKHHDFVEGVSARLIRKPAEKPQWQPANLSAVSYDDAQDFVTVPPGSKRLQLLTSGPQADYRTYPHSWIGLPTEDMVKDIVTKGGKSKLAIMQHFLQQYNGKAGVSAKVDEVLARKCKTDSAGNPAWL